MSVLEDEVCATCLIVFHHTVENCPGDCTNTGHDKALAAFKARKAKEALASTKDEQIAALQAQVRELKAKLGEQ